MNIAAIGNFWYPERGGGLERYFYGLVSRLADIGEEVECFVTATDFPRTDNLRGHLFGGTETPLPRRLYRGARAFALLPPRSLDLVNVHFALHALSILPFIPRRVPIVYHFHGPWALESLAEGESRHVVYIKKALEQAVIRRSAHFVTASESFAGILRREYGAPADAITTLPLAVDTDFFAPVDRSIARQELGWHHSDFIIFTARRLVRRVGVRELIAGLTSFSDLSGISVKIAGTGPLESEFREQINALQLDNVELVGYLSEEQLRLAYSAANVTVLPTQQLEGFGLTFAESLACGTPVIATPVGGVREHLSPLNPGLITESSESTDIGLALRNVALHPEWLPSRSQCRSFAVREFSWPTNIERVRGLFQLTVDRAVPGRV